MNCSKYVTVRQVVQWYRVIQTATNRSCNFMTERHQRISDMTFLRTDEGGN